MDWLPEDDIVQPGSIAPRGAVGYMLPRSSNRVCQSCDRDQALRDMCTCLPPTRATSAIVSCLIAALYQAPGLQVADIQAATGRLFLKRNIPNSHKPRPLVERRRSSRQHPGPRRRCAGAGPTHAASVSVYRAHLRRRRLPRPESHESRCPNRRLDDRHLSSAATRRLPYAAAPVRI